MKETRQLVKHQVGGCLHVMDQKGLSHSKSYDSWHHMVRRCYNPSCKEFKNYGARGIMVCNRWKSSFLNFYSDMGHRPTGMVLDRINNDGNYELNNCRWTTPLISARNRRNVLKDIAFVDGESNQERDKKVRRIWEQNHKEHAAKTKRIYYLNHKTEILAYKKQWRKDNYQKNLNTERRWRAKNRERLNAYMRARRAKLRQHENKPIIGS